MVNTTAVFISFFSGFFYSRASGLAPDSRQVQLTVIVVNLAALVIYVSQGYVNTLGFRDWVANKHWAVVTMKFINFVNVAAIFVASQFILASIDRAWTSSRLSWFESFALIYVMVRTIFYVTELLHMAKKK